MWELKGCHRSTLYSAQPQRAGRGVQDDKTLREIQRWVWPGYETASALSPKFSSYLGQGLQGHGTLRGYGGFTLSTPKLALSPCHPHPCP